MKARKPVLNDMGYSELIRCLLVDSEACLNVYVCLGQKRMCSLGTAKVCVEALQASDPEPSDMVRVVWSMGDNLAYRIEFPFSTLEFDGNSAAVKTCDVQLFAMYGSEETQIELASAVQWIDFGGTFEVIPADLYLAAVVANVEEVA